MKNGSTHIHTLSFDCIILDAEPTIFFVYRKGCFMVLIYMCPLLVLQLSLFLVVIV